MAVKGAGRNRYYKKINVTNNENSYYDINPSGVYGDLFEGQASTAKITGGAESRHYLSDIVIPDSDSFGEGKLVGLKQYYFPTDITIENDSYTPEIKLWKAKQPIGETNEGAITVNNRAVTVITANTSLEIPWIYEPFNGGATKVETLNSYTTTSSFGEPYITLSDAYFYQNRGLSLAELSKRYGEIVSVGGKQEIVIFVHQKRVVGNRLVPSGNTLLTTGANLLLGVAGYMAIGTVFLAPVGVAAVATITADQEWSPVKSKYEQIDVHFPNLPNNILKYTTTSQSSITTGSTSQKEMDADISNTLIQDVFKNGDFKVFDSDGTRLMTAKASFSSDEYITEGQSLKLRTYWHQTVVPRAEGGQTFTNDWGPWYCNDRQEVKAVFEIPYPHSIDTAGDSTLRTGDKLDGQDFSHQAWFTAPSVAMDLNIDELSPLWRAYGAGDATGGNSGHRESVSNADANSCRAYSMRQCAWVRGLAITFSTTRPKSNETFYTFMARMTSLSKAEELADSKPDAEAINEISKYGNATGVIIGKIPINFERSTSKKVKARKNLDSTSVFPSHPIVALPINSTERVSTNDPGSNYRNYTFNLTNLVESHSGETGFHESIGQTLHWYVHDDQTTTTGTYGKSGEPQYELGNQGVVLEEKKWLNFKFTMYKGSLYYQVKNSKTGELISKPIELVGYGKGGAPVFNNADDCPRYVTVWNFNFPGKAQWYNATSLGPWDYSMWTLDHKDGNNKPLNFDTGNTLYLDNITMAGFNHVHSNATVNSNNPARGKIIIPNNLTNAVSDPTSDSGLDIAWPSSTYISLGFDNQEDFDKAASGATHNLWFGGINNPGNLEALHHSSTDIAIRAGFSTNAGDERIGGQSNQSFFTYSTTPSDTGNAAPFANRGLNTSGVTNRGLDFDGTTQIDKFSKKGGVILDFKSDHVTFGTQWPGGATATAARRENLFTSARILDISQAAEGILGVDNINIFHLPDDTEYVIYTNNQPPNNKGKPFSGEWGVGNSMYHGLVVKLKERASANNIRVNKDCRFNQAGHNATQSEDISKEYILQSPEGYGRNKLLCHPINKTTLWISPLKYWLTLEVRNTSATEGVQGPTRSYSTICTVNQGSSLPATSDYGATYNEYLYTDAGTYLNAWNLMPSIDDCAIETQIDYGFDIMSEDNHDAGYITSLNLSTDLDSYSKWLVFDASSAIEKEKLDAGEIFTSMLSSAQITNESSLTIATSENTDKIVNQSYGSANTKQPFSLAIYEDELPKISEFKATPNETNPYYTDFTWNTDAADSWYGFIIIDTDIPSHQYHKSPWHVPMWRPLPSTENSFMNWPPSLDDSEGDIIDYKQEKHFQYGFFRGDKDTPIRADHVRPSASTTKGAHTKGTVADYTTFLDPEGLSGWCHNFSGDDLLWVSAPSDVNGFDKEGILNEEKCSFNMHIRPTEYPTLNAGIAVFGGAGSTYSGASVILESDGKISAYFGSGWNADGHAVHLESHSVAPLDGTPTNIIITFDKTLSHGNCKLFINGKLEDQSGKAITSGNGTTSRWDTSKVLRIDGKSLYATWYLGGGPGQVIGGAENFKGRMEEVVYYPYVIYPVNASEGKFTWTAPVSDMATDGTRQQGRPISYFARLFVKDFHNIRGTSHLEVATTSPITIHRAGLRL